LDTHILLIDCPDEKGLIYRITGVIFWHGGNIISNQEFVDHETEHFLMRTEFTGTMDTDHVVRELQAVLPPRSTVRLAKRGKRRIVIMATKEHHCLGDLLIRHAFSELNAHICAVVSNHQTLQPIVEQFGIPFHFISHQNKSREEHELEILQLLDQFNPEYIVLAKYMRILTNTFISRYPNRIINIHHSFLPAFVGADPYRQAFERGVKIIGATAHFVTEDLDAGPIIAQDVIPVNHTHNASGMAQAGRDVEKIVLAKALKLVLEERVFLVGKRTIIFE